MADLPFETAIGPELAGALAKKGYTTLTPVQEAVLDPELAGRDLRISSQTGSGKTVAIGFTVRDVVSGDSSSSEKGAGRPLALVVAPTRELAKQVEVELSWLFAPLRVGVASVTGGGNYRDERRALGSSPAIIVGTPGRLLDHLQRGAIDGSQLGAVVLDEADRMLDLGFRDDLEAILAFAPEGHRTHLVSATFPREVTALANRVQTDPARIEGTPLGSANTDIEHLVHLVLPHERLDAIVNLMLETPGATTLIFARTRADVGELSHLLAEAGFSVDSLSGEMEQRERNKALAAFKRGDLDALVATDVAARGIDVQDVARVLHAEPPADPDAYTHRSGRTGRAGRKGKSSVLVTPAAMNRVSSLLKRAGVRWRMDPVPTAETIEAAREERLFAQLTTLHEDDPAEEPVEVPEGFREADDRSWALAKRIAAAGEATRALARMIARTRASGPEARAITVVTPLQKKARPWEERERGERETTGMGERRERPPARGFGEVRPLSEPRVFGEPRGLRPDRGNRFEEREPGPARTPRDPATDAGSWVSFRVSWGQIHGADARRLLAMVCRRGGIRGSDVGAIRVARTFSTVDVAAAAASAFERAAQVPDPRDPRVKISPASQAHDGAPTGDRPSKIERPSKRAVDAERPSKKTLETERPSKKTLETERPSKKTLETERPSKKTLETEKPSKKTLETEKPSKKTLETERPSKKTLETEKPSKKTLEVDKPSKPARAEEREQPVKVTRAPEPERPSRGAHGDRRGKPSQPERYSRRPQPKPGTRPQYDGPRPQHDGPRPSHDGPRPSHDGPRPQHDRSRPPPDRSRPPYDRSRPPYDRSRPPHDRARPPYDRSRPPDDGPRSHDGPRPPQDRPRPHPGTRPSGPPQPSRHGDARPKRKKP